MMAKFYLEKLTDMMAGILPEISSTTNLEIKHFFSGAAVYVDGNMCISLSPAGFGIKLPEPLRAELMREKGTKHLRYFPKSPPKKEYVVLPEKMVDDKVTLYFWVKKSIDYVMKPPKTMKNGNKL